jgi:hypothetical protein
MHNFSPFIINLQKGYKDIKGSVGGPSASEGPQKYDLTMSSK